MLVECLVAAGPGEVKLVFVYISKQWIRQVANELLGALSSIKDWNKDGKEEKAEEKDEYLLGSWRRDTAGRASTDAQAVDILSGCEAVKMF